MTRGGHTFHVYGSGKDRVVVEVGGGKDKTSSSSAVKTGGTQAGSTSSGSTTSAKDSGATSQTASS